MDLHQRLQLAAKLSAQFEYKSMILPRGEPQDLIPKHDQCHLLRGWDNVTGEQQTTLASQIKTQFPVVISSDDPEKKRQAEENGLMGVTNIFHESLKHSSTLPARFEAPDHDKDMIDVAKLSAKERSRLETAGIEVLASGRGAVCVLAGGSGTRLGVSYPKGMLVCPDTVAPRSLFQWHCERILAIQKAFDAKKPIPFVVMLSPQNEVATREFFTKNNFFGLDQSQVLFFTQSVMPCFNPNGKIIMSNEGAIANAPGGNAGIYPAIYQSGVLQKLRDQFGVKLIQIVTVDNLLVSVADPILFGSAVIKNENGLSSAADNFVDVIAKTTPKLHDGEAVGVFAKRVYPSDFNPQTADLRWGCLEYSEVGPELAAKKRGGDSEERMFNAANIAVHLFSVDFVERAARHMLSDFTYYHVAKKPVPTKIPIEMRAKLYGDDDYLKEAAWSPETESSAPGIKLEAFIFDLFQYAKTFKLLQVTRSEEFSAIKNADDSTMLRSTSFGPPQTSCLEDKTVIKKDSPQTAVRDLHTLHAKWLISFLRNNNNNNNNNAFDEIARIIEDNGIRVEFSPLAICRESVLEQAKEDLLKNILDENGNGDESILKELKEFVDAANTGVIVLYLNDDRKFSVVDMSRGMEEFGGAGAGAGMAGGNNGTGGGSSNL